MKVVVTVAEKSLPDNASRYLVMGPGTVSGYHSDAIRPEQPRRLAAQREQRVVYLRENRALTTLDYDQGGSGPTNVVIAPRYNLGSNVAYQGNPPLFRFEATRIEGLTFQPIVLRGFFSQSWSGNHRQSYEFFLFEPHLEQGIAPAILQELEAKHIRMIHVEKNKNGPTRMFTYPTHDAGPCRSSVLEPPATSQARSPWTIHALTVTCAVNWRPRLSDEMTTSA